MEWVGRVAAPAPSPAQREKAGDEGPAAGAIAQKKTPAGRQDRAGVFLRARSEWVIGHQTKWSV
jgi:hypothetical protein